MTTYDEANLMVHLMRWGNESGLEAAMREIFSPQFDPETATMENESVAKVLGYFETVATFVKRGVLDGDLVRDLVWVEGVWSKVSKHALAAREYEHEPRLYENFELLIKG